MRGSYSGGFDMLKNKQWELFFGLLLLLLLLAFTVTAYAQQTGTSYGPSPVFPDAQSQSREMPPDSGAPVPQQISTEQAETQIQDHLMSEPALKDSDLRAEVDDNSVVLTGVISLEQQRDIALRIARSYAGGRHIMDKMLLEKWRTPNAER
jgi:osmotically-inducible protein OsmY